MDYRELINEAQEILEKRGGRNRDGKKGRKKASSNTQGKKKRTPEELAASKEQSERDKAANKSSMGRQVSSESPKEDDEAQGDDGGFQTMTTTTSEPTGDTPTLEPSEPPQAVKPIVPAGTKETQKKYKVDLNKPIEAAILGLRCIHDTGTTPINGDGKKFLDQINLKLTSKESANEKFMKKAADKYYKEQFTSKLILIEENDEESDVTVSDENVIVIDDKKYDATEAEKKLNLWITPFKQYTHESCYNKVREKIKTKLKINRDYKRALQAEGRGMVNAIYTTLVEAFPFISYQQAVVDAAERDLELEDWIKACIYNRLYYIYIIYRFSVSIGVSELIPNSLKAKTYIKLSSMDKELGGDKGNEQSNFGTETNVQNIFKQALIQASEIESTDITFFESDTHTINMANRFLGEVAGGTRDLTNIGKKVVLPKILTDFVALMEMVQKRKAFSLEKFNDLVNANELNKVDLMQGWLDKNKKVAEKNNYLQTVLQFMVYAKMYGSGGDVGWANKFMKRNPKTAALLRAPGKIKDALGTAKGISKAIF